ncbi:ABC transporter ATP-binding protein [Betaproteobacteria bacterium]|nr:ABC transporter ATP-binding protein [Betaproteobacteria bacterium]GHT97445.1 ABC transporter ATP-binding protein [Betaproteobacteria bacterium]GHU00481.1 ABC transporter ATP-binding protein [Betaproteobacteria bacterium]GHU18295.1 ABC transporter ATP-binding protein [Betaproteobacteria bacterium]GHU25805.1 ABC transporter ATP-binding protein [Betaproteobacteria bacterium]
MSDLAPARPNYRAGRRFWRLAVDYWNGSNKWTVRGAVLLLLALTVAQVVLAVWISYWHRDLFDALEAHSLDEFVRLIVMFALIFAVTMGVTALHLYVKRWLQLDWRRWMTGMFLDQWLARSHHYRLQLTAGEHDNPDGRIAEDVKIATEVAITLAHSLVFSVLVLGSFVDILLSVSGSAPLPGTSVSVPGYLVLMAFLYAGVGSVLGLLLGRPLIRTTNRLQTVEANLRFGLARVREHSEAIALVHGGPRERLHAGQLFADVGMGWNRQTVAYLGIVAFSTGYGALLPVFPILIAAPQYIAGAMTLGLLMQAAQAFQRLTSALSWPIDNLGEIARCRASIDRIITFHEDMKQLAREDAEDERGTRRIVLRRDEQADLEIRNLCLESASGQRLLTDFNLVAHHGERLLFTGDQTVTVALFKTVAGLWPWGRGEILLPAGCDIMFVPLHPYLYAGTLREVLSYPGAAGLYSNASFHRALECAGIRWLQTHLDDFEDWGRTLPLPTQQRLGMARLFLQQPQWVFIEELADAFDSRDEADTLELLHHELPGATLLNISRHLGSGHFYNRHFELRV